jgi:hypothetical protein
MNIAVSLGEEAGILKAPEGGTTRQSIRLNVDHRMGDKFNISLGSFFNNQNLILQDLGVDAFRAIQVISPTIDLFAKDSLGQFIPHPDAADARDNESFNPVYGASVRESYEQRIGFQANSDATYRPFSFLTLGAQGGYQRSDRSGIDTWIPPGTVSAQGVFPYPGRIITSRNFSESFNTQIRASVLQAFGDLTARSSILAAGQMRDDDGVTLQGDTLSSGLVKDIDNAALIESNGHVLRTVKSLSYSGTFALDYAGRYVVEGVYRRDGTSLLPPATRWQGNFRASSAWLVAEESWWPLANNIPVFKLRYSIGSAGNNPNFTDRYETYNLAAGSGRITKANSGNDEIRPEHVTEHEMGLDMSFRNRINLELNYSRTDTKDAIRADSILNYVGANTQVRNMGDLRGETYEATVQGQWINRRNLRWSSTWTMDRSRSKITKYPRNCIGDVNAQFQKECEGFVFGELTVNRITIDSKDQLSFIHAQNGNLDAFDINDDGIVVAVGKGGSWKDGRWGSTVTVDNIAYQWGMPIQYSETDTLGNRTDYRQTTIGQSLPDFAFGFGNDVNIGNLNLHLQLVGAQGGLNYNFGRQARYYDETDGDLDQAGKPEYAKKPAAYYNAARSRFNAGLNENSCALNDQCRSASWFIEDATFVKISEALIRYRLNNSGPLRRLGVTQTTLSLIGRNLYSFDNYKGYDPEVGTANGIRQDGTATRPMTYPTYRNFTFRVQLAF